MKRFVSPTCQSRKPRIAWGTAFPQALKLTAKERDLQLSATVVYKRASTLGNLLTNYRSLAHASKQPVGQSRPCEKCALCGNHGRHKSMVYKQRKFTTHGQVLELKQDLDCKCYGIYAATCNICSAQYIGQTKNRFSTRWTHHRSTWKERKVNEENDNAALLHHYASKHTVVFSTHPDITQCFSVTFLQQPAPKDLDACEAKWLKITQATINIQKMVLPRLR
uniref:Methionine--tRNA ligase, cytoplasmic n=1 Tax=Phallusia mammillata TaxID=59560 RepID=A0A6F9DL11_9ASCI|nr:methionine--tRNA ligase, cytoplasmic [Phallusia mammillata]